MNKNNNTIFIHQYTSEIDSYDKFNDVFKEIDSIRKSTFPRRFSFSIPNDDNDHTPASQLNIPPVPPSSPQLDSTPKLSILVPDNDDFYLDATDNLPSSDDEETQINDIQNSLNFSKQDLIISPDNDKTLYKLPPRKSYDARHIWKMSKIPRVAYIRDIEWLVLDWAFTYAHLEISNKKIKSITWKSKSKCLCKSSWQAFLHWLICATFST